MTGNIIYKCPVCERHYINRFGVQWFKGSKETVSTRERHSMICDDCVGKMEKRRAPYGSKAFDMLWSDNDEERS